MVSEIIFSYKYSRHYPTIENGGWSFTSHNKKIDMLNILRSYFQVFFSVHCVPRVDLSHPPSSCVVESLGERL